MPTLDPDRRAWHRAQATDGLDEDVAAELERSAGRARARGGLAAGAAFHERAAELTPDPRRRAQRALAAAQGKHQAGAPDAALRLLAMAEAGPLDELERARAQLLHAQIAFATTRGRDAPPLLLAAAKRLEPLDATLARETYLEAFAAALSADRLVRGGDAREVAAAVLAADWEPSTRACDLLLDGLALRYAEGCAAGGACVEARAARVPRRALSEDEELRWLWLACHIARDVGDDEAWDELTARQLELARQRGRVLAAARRARRPLQRRAPLPAGSRWPHRWPPRRTPSSRPPAATSSGAPASRWPAGAARRRGPGADRGPPAGRARRGEGLWLTANDWGTAVLYNGLGRYDDALAAIERAAEDPHGTGLSTVGGVRAHRGRRPQRQRRSAPPARSRGSPRSPRPTARTGRSACARLARRMLAEGAAAERLYREAIERLSRTRIRVALARAHLLYGEWLRRENRRVDAREQLRVAHEMFTDMGNEPFAERARRELLATGETVRKRTVETLDELTPQETQIARMAADGFTNPEIGAQLFLSPRTVEWHLRKVFTKLGISSRRELRAALPGREPAPA